ncbi:phage major capsid protein [Mesonia aquimarina]|uniref:phage major capsid protein n=1 Tax=Mesonia aquimarina TaxID=1504967 RepID=UPI000EF5D345|nr:phage major capsid protein [Mesonia aquimarina]
MNKLAELQQQRAEKVKAQQAIVDEAQNSESRDMNDDQEKRFDALDTEIKEFDKKIERQKKMDESAKRAADLNGTPKNDPQKRTGGKAEKGEAAEKRKIMSQFSMKRAMELQLENRSIDGVESEVNEIAKDELRDQGLKVPARGMNIPSEMMFRADSHTVTQDSGNYGGKLVREEMGEMLPTFVDRLKIEDLGVTIKRGLNGDYPLNRGGEFTFENLAETASTTSQKVTYDKRVLSPKRTALETAISYQLIAQSAFNIEQDVRQRITTALNKRLMLDMLNGDGNAPNTLGLLNDPDLAFVFGGAEGPLTLAKILELEGEVDDENVMGDPIFLIHKKLAALAKGITIDSGSGQFLMDKQNTLYGTDTVKTSLLPVLSGTDDNYPLIYGDFSNVYAGFWGGINFTLDPYTKASSNEIRMIVNVHRDIMAANPEGFAVNKKITLS